MERDLFFVEDSSPFELFDARLRKTLSERSSSVEALTKSCFDSSHVIIRTSDQIFRYGRKKSILTLRFFELYF